MSIVLSYRSISLFIFLAAFPATFILTVPTVVSYNPISLDILAPALYPAYTVTSPISLV